MVFGQIVAGHVDGDVYCIDCLGMDELEKAEAEGVGGAILGGDEFTSKLCCSTCQNEIEGLSYTEEAYYPEIEAEFHKIAEALDNLQSLELKLGDKVAKQLCKLIEEIDLEGSLACKLTDLRAWAEQSRDYMRSLY